MSDAGDVAVIVIVLGIIAAVSGAFLMEASAPHVPICREEPNRTVCENKFGSVVGLDIIEPGGEVRR